MQLLQLVGYLLRLVGYLGLFALLVIACIAAIVAWPTMDWYGFVMLALLVGLIMFLAHSLWSQGRRTTRSEPALDEQRDFDMDLVTFLRGPLMHTAEGLVVFVGSTASLLFALGYWLAKLFSVTAFAVSGTVFIFASWPLVLLVFYVWLCAPHFNSSVFTTLSLLCLAGMPYYIVYL